MRRPKKCFAVIMIMLFLFSACSAGQSIPSSSMSSVPIEESKRMVISDELRQTEFPIVGAWMWPGSVYDITEDEAQELFQSYKELGITDLYFLVKGTNGTVYFNKTNTAIEKAHSDRDVLDEAINLAHANGIRLHAWFTSANDKLYKEKNPDEGLYHFVRGRDNDVVNITSSQYTEYMKAIIRELVANYDIDGIHFDYIRYNHVCNGWGPEDIEELERRGANVDHLKELIEKTFYRDDKDDKAIFEAYSAGDEDAVIFAHMRRDNVVHFARELTETVRSINPDIVISAALMPEGAYGDIYDVSGINGAAYADLHYGQNYEDAAKMYDYVIPMEYSDDYGMDSQWTVNLAENAVAAGNTVIVGIQAYTPATSESVMSNVLAVSEQMDNKVIQGICLFRSGTFNCAKVTADDEGLLKVDLLNQTEEFNIQTVSIELPKNLNISDIQVGEPLKEKVEILTKDNTVELKFTNGGFSVFSPISLYIRAEGMLSEPIFVRMLGDDGADIATYQTFVADSVVFPE